MAHERWVRTVGLTGGYTSPIVAIGTLNEGRCAVCPLPRPAATWQVSADHSSTWRVSRFCVERVGGEAVDGAPDDVGDGRARSAEERCLDTGAKVPVHRE